MSSVTGRAQPVSMLSLTLSIWSDRILWLTLLVLLILVILPYLIAVAAAPAGMEFLGSFYNSQDISVYLSAIRAGARGEWLRTLPFTSEPHSPALYYPFYLLLGHLAPPTLLTFHLARVVCATLMVFCAWWLVTTILPRQLERYIALILGILGMGIGWLVLLAGLSRIIHPTDIFSTTANLLNAALLSPHFALGAAMQFATLALYLQAQRSPYRQGTLLAGAVSCLIMGWVLPYQLFVVAVVIFSHIFLQMWRSRRWITPALRAGFFILVPSSGVVLYYAALARIVPFWSDLIAQWPVYEHMFSALDFAAGYGLLWVMASIGAAHLVRQPDRTDGEELLIAWSVANAVMLISPLDFSDRTSLGFGGALAMLSAIGLMRPIRTWASIAQLERRVRRRYPEIAAKVPVLVLLTVLPSAALLVIGLALLALVNPDLPYYLPSSERAAIEWLHDHATTRDVVLASPPVSNLIPAMTDARVYAGHSHETYQSARKLKEVADFFDAARPSAERRQLLAQGTITYVVVQPGAYAMGMFNGVDTPYLRPVYQTGDITIFQVVLDGS